MAARVAAAVRSVPTATRARMAHVRTVRSTAAVRMMPAAPTAVRVASAVRTAVRPAVRTMPAMLSCSCHRNASNRQRQYRAEQETCERGLDHMIFLHSGSAVGQGRDREHSRGIYGYSIDYIHARRRCPRNTQHVRINRPWISLQMARRHAEKSVIESKAVTRC